MKDYTHPPETSMSRFIMLVLLAAPFAIYHLNEKSRRFWLGDDPAMDALMIMLGGLFLLALALMVYFELTVVGPARRAARVHQRRVERAVSFTSRGLGW